MLIKPCRRTGSHTRLWIDESNGISFSIHFFSFLRMNQTFSLGMNNVVESKFFFGNEQRPNVLLTWVFLFLE